MDETNIFQSIFQSKATLKIVTKTKNERFFIEKWIQHHLAIIGEGKLIIFDNMSDDEHVLNIYEKYKENILLIKFDCNHNDLHRYKLFTSFYQSLRESTEFFTILDSDEFLYLYDEKTNKGICDTSIQDFLKANEDCDFFAPCWLTNLEKSENIFTLDSQLPRLFDRGKPIVHTKILNNPKIKQYDEVVFRHTYELPSLQYPKTKTAFFIAHLCNLNIEQRITTNMNKLVSNGLLRSSSSFGELFRSSVRATENTDLQALIKATRELVKIKITYGDYPPNQPTKEKTLTIENDASLSFSDTFFKQAFCTLMKRNYLDLIGYDGTAIDTKSYPTLRSWIEK